MKKLSSAFFAAHQMRIFRSMTCRVLDSLGFKLRIRSSHHIFFKEGVKEILNLQPRGSKAKPYQIKQVRQIILKYKLAGEDDG